VEIKKLKRKEVSLKLLYHKSRRLVKSSLIWLLEELLSWF